MKFLRVLGWIFIPYVILGFQWNKLGSVGKGLGSAWAAVSFFGLMFNVSNTTPSPVKQTAVVTQTVQTEKPAATETTKKETETPVSPTTTPAPSPQPTETPAPENKPTISKAEFDKLKNGMTYEQVVEIVGGPGEMMSEVGSAGDQFHTVMYTWEGEGSIGANANAMFQGGKLNSKAQLGLQ
ncbi:DUF3862 domain-containing protein [Brevibacillus sp. HD3.3A]|uniref:DUF3862 domain-containing protein n=1 Tax=Brevibacillus sp. HD3.3A TaxID=2738979 RepID=UPI00156BBE59|nr:DUF3862 domain-containing protein [Brevibacillus sp. HD3.3A]UED72101.1 DUF3862 domain-containing protein [Brevibacillus sp. HD3.3A]